MAVKHTLPLHFTLLSFSAAADLVGDWAVADDPAHACGFCPGVHVSTFWELLPQTVPRLFADIRHFGETLRVDGEFVCHVVFS